MGVMKGPGVFLAQFLRDEEPYNNLENIGRWVAGLGYKGVQIPSWDARVFDRDTAAESKTYCEDYKGELASIGLEPTELAAYLAGQCMGIHPAYEIGFEAFHPAGLSGEALVEWASAELKKCVQASAHMGLKLVPVLSGGLAWHMIYPWPQRPDGVIAEAMGEMAQRWRPVLDYARENGVSIGYELHPGSDIYDGATYEMFLDLVDDHEAACINYDPSHFLLQQLDYIEFVKIYGERIKGFHVKDAEFRPTGRVGVYGGYQSWAKRPGRFRSLGDGQVDFPRLFTVMTEIGYEGWAVLEWECALKSPEQGAAEGAPFIQKHIIQTSNVAFDDFAAGLRDVEKNRKMLGLT